MKCWSCSAVFLFLYLSNYKIGPISGHETPSVPEDDSTANRPIRQATDASPGNSNSTEQVQPVPVTSNFALKDLILVLMAKHGEAQTAKAFHSLDSLPLGTVMRILLVEVDKDLAADIIQLQTHAQTNDKALVSVIARIVTGDGSVSKDIFMWDEKLRKFPWWARIRQRMFVNLDKYVANFKGQGVSGKEEGKP